MVNNLRSRFWFDLRSSGTLRSADCPETSVRNFQSTLPNIPEEGRFLLHHGGNLKYRKVFLFNPLLPNNELSLRKIIIILANETNNVAPVEKKTFQARLSVFANYGLYVPQNQTCGEVSIITKCLYIAGIFRESMVMFADHRLYTLRPAEQNEGKNSLICLV